MKYIKTFEIASQQLQVNDYVICHVEGGDYDSEERHLFYNFVSSHIGQVILISNYKIITKYDNIPEEIKSYFTYNNDTATRLYSPDIKYYSKSKEVLETILDQNKFNL